jgi:hypothetical protein
MNHSRRFGDHARKGEGGNYDPFTHKELRPAIRRRRNFWNPQTEPKWIHTLVEHPFARRERIIDHG